MPLIGVSVVVEVTNKVEETWSASKWIPLVSCLPPIVCVMRISLKGKMYVKEDHNII